MVIAFNGLGCSLSLLAPTGDFGENVPPAAHFSHQLEKWAVGDTFLIQKSYGKKVTRRRQNNAHKRLKVSTRPPDGRNFHSFCPGAFWASDPRLPHLKPPLTAAPYDGRHISYTYNYNALRTAADLRLMLHCSRRCMVPAVSSAAPRGRTSSLNTTFGLCMGWP